ncbi:MAG: hypothetical protein Q9227_000668 [Pyrenula ochraceoflavens]
MPLDHFPEDPRYAPHSNETFVNQYWLDTSNYRNGGPVIIHALGEDSPSYDLTWLQKGLLHELAVATGGVAILWGQRYYSGHYFPFNPYTDQNLRFHSTEQALADLAYFAGHVTIPGLESKNLTAPGTPWIVSGGSYAGVISAFTRIQYPNVFWGGLASSGVSTGVIDGWQMYDVVRRYGPPDCVEAQQKLINIADNIFLSGNDTLIAQLKIAFNAQTLTANFDFANVLSIPPGAWQGQTWVPGSNYPFTGPGTFCANVTNQSLLFSSTANLTATARSLIAAGGWSNETSTLLYPFLNWIGTIQSSYFSSCLRYSSSLDDCWATSTTASPFEWLTCTEYGQFATSYTPGSPGHPSAFPVASQLLTVDHNLDHCKQTYNLTSGPNLDYFNQYGGFNLSFPRLILSAGQVDMYRPFGPLAEEIAYGVPNPRLASNGTADAPEIVIENGVHEWDLYGLFPNETSEGVPPPAVNAAHAAEIEAVKGWLAEWAEEHGGKKDL